MRTEVMYIEKSILGLKYIYIYTFIINKLIIFIKGLRFFLILNITFAISRAILAVLWTQVSGIQTD